MFMFAGGVRFHTSICCIFDTAVVVVACVIFIPGFSPCRGYWVRAFCCLFVVYIYVRLIMSSYLLFCIYFSMFGISHAVQMKRNGKKEKKANEKKGKRIV